MAKAKSNKINLDDREYLARLGKRIKELRLAKGYANQEIFAYENEIPRAQYGRYERGFNITFLSLLKILRALDITFEEFFSEGFE